MLQVCRTCLKEINDLNFISLGDATSLTDSLKVKDVLAICVPELALDIISNPVMCATCMNSLHVTYEFKRKCLRTEERIRSYVHSIVLGAKDVDIATAFREDEQRQPASVDAVVTNIKTESGEWMGYELDVPIKKEPQTSDEEGVDKGLVVDGDAAGLSKFVNSKSAKTRAEGSACGSENQGLELQDTDSGLSSSNADLNLNMSCELSEGEKLRHALESRMYVCLICTKVFDRRSSLYLHKKIHEDKPFKCTMCDYMATQRINLVTHMRGHTGEKPYVCDVCDFRTAHHSSIKHHMRVHTGKKAYPCDDCEFSSSFKSTLTAHEKVHEAPCPYKCDDCEFQADKESTLLEHLKTHGDTKSRKCMRCDFVAETTDDLVKHLKNHGAQKRFKCTECDYNTSVKCNLQRHLSVHTGKRNLTCSKCGLTAANSSRLRRHMRTHRESDALFKCKECSFTALRREEAKIRTHLKTHVTVCKRPFNCTECDYTASCRVHIVKHMRIHTGEKPFKCEICHFTASHKFSLKRHMTIHSDAKPFKCTMCNYTAKRKVYLLDHIRTHTGDKPYKCSQCIYSASRRPMLIAHQKLHNPNSETVQEQDDDDDDIGLIIDTSCSDDDGALNEGSLGKHLLDHKKTLQGLFTDNELSDNEIPLEKRVENNAPVQEEIVASPKENLLPSEAPQGNNLMVNEEPPKDKEAKPEKRELLTLGEQIEATIALVVERGLSSES